MFDHFGIHQNVLTQELFEMFINYDKFYNKAIICNRSICYRPLYLPLPVWLSNIMLEVKIKFRLKAFKLKIYWLSILSPSPSIYMNNIFKTTTFFFFLCVCVCVCVYYVEVVFSCFIPPTFPPFFTAALVSVVAQLAGSMVPSPGLCKVPYKSSTFINGYSSLDSLGPRTNDSTP